jgi:hypothetical protein
MTRILRISLFVLLVCLTCVGQTSYKNLTPGKNTKADVERALGRPLKQISKTLAEYKSNQGTEQIFVQYIADSNDVARIEVTYADAIERSSAVAALNLPSRSTGWQINSKSRLEEYFSAACVVLTYVGADASTGVSRIGYYSRQLFDSSSAKLPPDSLGKDPPGLNRSPAAANNSGRGQPLQAPAGNYEDIVTRANSALQARDFQTAVKLSKQAVAVDPNQPRAYEVAGIAQLYGLGDVSAAATAMRAARERGGIAAFTVSHDHDGFFQTYCQGSLEIINFGVSYSSYDGAHSFLVSHKNITEVGLNSLVGSNLHSFHIKVNQNGKTRTYNFAPGTLSAAESNLILELLKNP